MAEPDRKPRIPDREAEALAEIAATRVSRGGTWSLVAVFVVATLLGPASELVPLQGRRVSARQRGPVVPISWGQIGSAWRLGGWQRVDERLKILLRSIRERAERDSAFSRLVRPPLQSFLVNGLRYGNAQVLVGEGEWLYYQRPFDQVVAPPFLAPETLERRARPGWSTYPARHPDPVAGLLRLHRALARRGARLVLMPVPDKEQVYPEHLRSRSWEAPPVNPSYDEMVAGLEAGGVPVFDASRLLFRAARARSDLWAKGDTHWTPAGLELAATGLADFLRERLGTLPGEPLRFGRRLIGQRLRGDFAGLLGFALDDAPRAGLEFEAIEVLAPDGRPFLASRAVAPILLLGDSYSLVYQSWNGVAYGAGLAEHLAFHTGRRVSQAASAFETELDDRIALLRRHPKQLKAARVVVYQVATRGLGTFDWKYVPLGPAGAKRRRPARPPGAP